MHTECIKQEACNSVTSVVTVYRPINFYLLLSGARLSLVPNGHFEHGVAGASPELEFGGDTAIDCGRPGPAMAYEIARDGRG